MEKREQSTAKQHRQILERKPKTAGIQFKFKHYQTINNIINSNESCKSSGYQQSTINLNQFCFSLIISKINCVLLASYFCVVAILHEIPCHFCEKFLQFTCAGE